MDKIGFLAIALIACMFFAATPAAAEVTTNEKQPFSMWVYIPGTGDIVQLEGILHVVQTTTLDENDGFHLSCHYQPQNVKGVSLNGDKYVATGVTRWNTNINGNVGEEYTRINQFHIVGTGKDAATYTVHQTVHCTINAQGEITSQVDNSWVTCK